jgi:hypothetical protein
MQSQSTRLRMVLTLNFTIIKTKRLLQFLVVCPDPLGCKIPLQNHYYYYYYFRDISDIFIAGFNGVF